MDNLQLSQVHKTDKVTFIRQVPWCALVQSPSLSLQGQALRKSLFTSDIFGTVTRTAARVNSSGLAQTAGWRPLTFHPISPIKICLLSLSALFSFHYPQGKIWVSSLCHGSSQLRAARSTPRLCIPKEHLSGSWHCLRPGRHRISNGEGTYWGQDFSPLSLCHFLYGSTHFEVRSLTEKTAWCSN
jgi:hypothetical protein